MFQTNKKLWILSPIESKQKEKKLYAFEKKFMSIAVDQNKEIRYAVTSQNIPFLGLN